MWLVAILAVAPIWVLFVLKGRGLSHPISRWEVSVLKPLSLSYVALVITALVAAHWTLAAVAAFAWYVCGLVGAGMHPNASAVALSRHRHIEMVGGDNGDLSPDESHRLAKGIIWSSSALVAVAFIGCLSFGGSWVRAILIALLGGVILAAVSLLGVVLRSPLHREGATTNAPKEEAAGPAVLQAPTEGDPNAARELDDAVWALFKQQELGLLNHSELSPGMLVDPRESEGDLAYADGTIWATILPWAEQVLGLRKDFRNIEGKATGLWMPGGEGIRSIQPTVLQEWVVQLTSLGAALSQTSAEASGLVDRLRGNTRGARALLKTAKYGWALRVCSVVLTGLCEVFLHRADERESDWLARLEGERARYAQAREAADLAFAELDDGLYSVRHVPVPGGAPRERSGGL